ncbi:MAG: NAD(P)-dependent oxidoreductase [Endomicrobium sp.]|jgi:nucleoside-diphosphate-sugar epimerase|nr:NAD(P)-dependent oxidoreductase [Endomicrobium sp.]
MVKTDKIVITGAAGLVGQNLLVELRSQGYENIVALDKNRKNMEILKSLHPEVTTVTTDLVERGSWETHFTGARRLFLLQAHITGSNWEEFQKDTLDSTENVLSAAKEAKVPFTVFAGSSVVHSVKSDNYSKSKLMQEEMTLSSGLSCCVLRPTLMFGWFDPKHLGWLARFMRKTPIFPIPGDGKFIRQPLYVLDFCKALIWCSENCPTGKIYDLTGTEDITYIDIIRTIKKIKKFKTIILRLPIPLFRFLMKCYALIFKKPAFVSDQLDSLIAGDYFSGVSFEENFGVTPTPFYEAMVETLTHEPYCSVVLHRVD